VSRPAADPLAAAGYRNLGQGRVILEGPAADLLAGWRRWLQALLQPPAELLVEAPPLIQPAVLRASRYLVHFPQQVVRGRGLRPSQPLYASPAACLHWYPALSGGPLGRSHAALVEATCSRFEDGHWRFPFRLAGFHMMELVVVGDPRRVELTRVEMLARVQSAFRRLRLVGAWEAAHDAFFLGSNSGAQAMQLLRDSKREYRVAPSGQRVALASCNRHLDTFGRAFRIRLASGRPAHSMCLAFGLERLTAAGLLQWGPSPAGWPAAVRP
jgi:hypothetical protein